MGCWNHTCAISNLHITAGQDVFVFLLLKNLNSDNSSFCHGNALYDVVPLPFYGKYDDYGGVEECHGFGLPIILEHLKSRLYKFGAGPNECHDCEVSPENFDITKLFEADHENRLGIQDHPGWSSDEYDINGLKEIHDEQGLSDSQKFELDRLSSKIKKIDTFRQVTHVVVHGDVARAILEKWYIEDYVGDGKGTKGNGNNYNHIYFGDLINFIPAYVQYRREMAEELERLEAELKNNPDDEHIHSNIGRLLLKSRYECEWNSPNLATRWMTYFADGGAGSVWGLINVHECIYEYNKSKDWDGLAKFIKETLTAAWINSFMSSTRRIWVKQAGRGSQNSEPLGYRILAETVLSILDEEEKEYDEINSEEDAELSDVEDES